MKSRFKKHLINLKRVRAGTYRKTAKGLYLDRNERVVPYDAKIFEALYGRLSRVPLNLYPDVDLFYEKLADWLNVKASQVFVTEGVSGAVKSIVETLASPGDNIIFPTPTFAMYPVYCDMFDLEYRTFGYTKGYQMDMEKMLRLMDRNTSIVFLPNPNVPIEGTLGMDIIESLASHCRKNRTFLVLDEVYYPFGGPTAIGLIKKYDNILIMRSFSKAFGLAGIRVGYIVGQEKVVDYVSKVRTGYEIDSASMAIASFFLDNYHIVDGYIEDVKEGMCYLKKELDRLGLEHNGGNASNFLFINMRDPGKASTVVRRLKDAGIHIRGNWPRPFDGGFSITAGPIRVMRNFVKKLPGALKGI